MRKTLAVLAFRSSLYTLPYSAWIAVMLMGVAEARPSSVATPGEGQQAADAGGYYLVDSTGAKTPLELNKAKLIETGIVVPGERSTVRLPAAASFKFAVRLPAGTAPQFFEFDSEQGQRIFPVDRTGEHKVNFARQRAKYAAVIHFDLSPVDGGFATLTPKEPLRPGEYCIGHTQSSDAACFGIDAAAGAVSASSAAPAASVSVAQPQAESQTRPAAVSPSQPAPGALSQPAEPAADNVVFYVDPAGNELPLEYDVPFRLGFSSSLVTKRQAAIVRFPQGTPLRFIARVPAGKAADLMQLDQANGWREIPIGWAGKSKGVVNQREAKRARIVPFTATFVGTAQLMTPDQPLVPGEYCFNLHTEEWFCFGVDEASADTQASSAATGGGGMGNAEVLKMVSAGLGPEVIVGAIRQATSHSFDLSIDSLIALKKANVPDAVVAAMQQANSPAASGGTPPVAHIPDSKIPVPPQTTAFYSVSPSGRLTMLEVGKPDIAAGRTTLIDGDQIYYQLFGAHSPVRFTDGTPVIVIKMPPKGHGFFDSLDKDNQFGDLYDMQIRRWEPTSGKREARFNTRAPHMNEHYDPEPGTFDFAIMKIGTGFYKIVPVEPLVPGEYCTGLHRLPTDIERLYCFGIDPAR